MFGMRDLIPWSRGRDVGARRGGWEHPLTSFQRDFDRMFDDLWQSFELPVLGRVGRERGFVTPRLDMHETDTDIVVTAELPGMEEKDVEVVLTDNVLTIKGEKRAEHEEKEEGYAYRERSFGAFERRIPLDTEIVGDKVEAAFRNGVLTVTLPKAPEARKHFKRIPVRGAGEGEKTEKKAA
ncbi:MAG: Hsp20/alpha crystallin family protein [Rhodospirillales bacterium]